MDTDLPVAPEADKKRKGDLFPVTSAGNRDLWTRTAGSNGDGAKDKDKGQ